MTQPSSSFRFAVTVPAALALVSLVLAAGCETPSRLIEKGRAAAEQQLAQVAAVAADAKKAPAVGAETPKLDASAPLHVCPHGNHTGRTSDEEAARTCNTRIVYLDQLESPSRPVAKRNERYEFGDTAWLCDARNFLDRGRLAPSEYGEGGEPSKDTVKRVLDDLARTRYLVVLKPARLFDPFEADAYLYDVDGAKRMGAVHFEARSAYMNLVYATGPNAGQAAGGRDFSAASARRALYAVIEAQVKGATFPSPDD